MNRSDRIPNNRCFMLYEGWGKLLHQFELNWSPNATPDFFIPKANIAGIEMMPDTGQAVSVHILRPVGSCRRVRRVLASCTADLPHSAG